MMSVRHSSVRLWPIALDRLQAACRIPGARGSRASATKAGTTHQGEQAMTCTATDIDHKKELLGQNAVGRLLKTTLPVAGDPVPP